MVVNAVSRPAPPVQQRDTGVPLRDMAGLDGMDRRPPRSTAPAAGGFLIALGLLVGGILGMTQGHAQRWMLLGAVIGIGAAVVVWLIDRRP